MNYNNENINRIAAYIKSGEKKQGDEKLGVEIEHFIVDKKTLKSIGYHGDAGAFNLLKRLSKYYREEVYVDGSLLGLKRDGSYITLEPAAQLEISIDAKKTIAEIDSEYQTFYREVSLELDKENLMLVNLGYQPASKIEQLEMIPKLRYEKMAEHMSTKGRYAKNMMKGTCSVQVSIDYTSENDFKNKFRLANCLSAIFAFMTDNAPVFEGEENPSTMIRTQIWNEVDPARCGIVEDALNKPFGYRDYAAYIYNRPALMTLKDGELSYTADKTLASIFSDSPMKTEEIEYALGMFFPDVRAKKYIEIRMADSMPREYMLAYTALIKGLFYNSEILNALLSTFASVNDEDEKAMKENLIQNGKNARIFNKNIYDICVQLIDHAHKILGDEKIYLAPLKELMLNKQKIFEAKNIHPFQTIQDRKLI